MVYFFFLVPAMQVIADLTSGEDTKTFNLTFYLSEPEELGMVTALQVLTNFFQ